MGAAERQGRLMNFDLTQEQRKAIAWGRDFAQKNIRPLAVELDRKGEFDESLFGKIADEGFLQVSVPKEYGGRGDGLFVRSLIAEEFAKECLSTAVNYTIAMGGLCVVKYFGSQEQKIQYIPDMVGGKCLGTFAFTEDEAGSDPGGAKTTAVADGDHYVINGKKSFITHGARAGVHVVFALTDPARGSRGMSAFLVPRRTPGVSPGKIYDKVGLRSCEIAEVYFDNCRIPVQNRIGEENAGLKYAMLPIEEGKVNVAFLSLGVAERALEESVAYMKKRQQFGKPLSAFQGLQWYVADMVTEIEAARLLSYKAALAGDLRQPDFGNLSAIAKYYASETAFRTVEKAIQIHGGNGITKDCPMERLYRDVQALRIYDGTSEIQKTIISKNALGGAKL
jgi:alkylation response protein AidB-like acyl-CoA dehydrogenase